jgi:hypothetical protein
MYSGKIAVPPGGGGKLPLISLIVCGNPFFRPLPLHPPLRGEAGIWWENPTSGQHCLATGSENEKRLHPLGTSPFRAVRSR